MPKRERPSQATSELLFPQPNADDIRKLRAAYRKRTGKEITDEEAREVLSRIIRFQYLNFLINAPGPGEEAGPDPANSGTPPLGRRAVAGGGWEKDPRDGPLVRRALEMRAAGATIRAVCAEMAAAGLRSRRGNEIGPSSMLKILTSARESFRPQHAGEAALGSKSAPGSEK